MISLGVIGIMAVVALRILWDGRIQASPRRVVSGWPVKLLGASLLLSAPLAYGCEAVLVWAAAGNATATSLMERREILFWSLLLGVSSLAAVVAIALSRSPVANAQSTESCQAGA